MFLHLEITSKCTLKCHACPRTQFADQYEITELSLEAIKNLTAGQNAYSKILLCGNHGDPIYHSHFHQVVEYLQEIFPRTPLLIATNGSHRSLDWWKKTALQLRPIDQVCFSIDGLKASSGIYRVNSSWESILEGITCLKDLGQCQLIWKWILFPYNIKDLLEAVDYAKKIGFDYFSIERSFRHKNDSPIFKTDITMDEVRGIFKNANIPTL